MRINKFSMKSFSFVTVVSLIGAITFRYDGWWLNFCFAVFGSALLAFVTCLVNYLVQLKIISEEITIKTYRYNIDANAALYSSKKCADIEKLVQTLAIMHNDIYEIYQLSFDLQESLFKYDKRKSIVEKFVKDIEKIIQSIADIESYIELNEQEAVTNKKLIYKDINEFIENQDIYVSALNVASEFKGSVSTRIDIKDTEKYKKEYAERYKNKIKNKS
ncbi:MAG: DUF4149 domain-containing protein [Bacilli bacterium]|nr:DUF4149 domain-containing protein [Bacilli bacterium]